MAHGHEVHTTIVEYIREEASDTTIFEDTVRGHDGSNSPLRQIRCHMLDTNADYNIQESEGSKISLMKKSRGSNICLIFKRLLQTCKSKIDKRQGGVLRIQKYRTRVFQRS